MPDALQPVARELGIPAMTRSIDHLVAALDRGAPLAQVLQAQATDTREDGGVAAAPRAGGA